jgi:hypothetical protein
MTPLATRFAEDFVPEFSEALLVAAVAQLGLDRSHLLLHAGDVGLDLRNVIFRRHVLHDVREHGAQFVERDFLGHAGIVRGGADCAIGSNERTYSGSGSTRILDAADKSCSVVDKKPDGKTAMMIGKASYKSKDEAEVARSLR